MKKRIVALLLCCVMLLTLSPNLIATAVADDDAVPTEQGVTVSPANAELPQNKKVTLTANAKDAASYQWQIKAEGDLWVDISGETESAIQVSYAMVASLLNGKQAQLRCKTDLGVSDSATVTVTAPKAVTAPAPAKAAPKAGTVVKEAEAIGDAVDAAATQEVTGDAPVPQKYTILVTYESTTGETVDEPYIAELAAGSSFNKEIVFPTVQGYLPYLNEAQVDSITLNIESIDQNYTYNVVYKPAPVDYTYIYYQQNIENDEYTEVDRQTAQGLTNDTVPETPKTYPGFYALPYERPQIAADGSTVVEVYFDRYYYLMTFDLDGGYGVEPIYARYGSTIDVDSTALKKAGYTFDKWEPELPATMPVDGGTYKVVWKANNTAKVTIVVWGENADDEKYSFYHNSEIMAKPGDKLTLDNLQGKLTCGKEEHKHSAACATNCNHVHNAACYGGTKQENPVDEKTGSANENIAQFKSLTGGVLENGKIYRVRCNAGSSTGNTTKYDKYYLYFNGTWYLANAAACDGAAIKESGDVNAHDHSGYYFTGNDKDHYWVYNAKLSCTHTHDDSCYTCGKPEHTHTSACYYNTSFMENPNLWNLVKSDEVTVNADGTTILNVYYDRVEFTLTFYYDLQRISSNEGEYKKQSTITAKWGADIGSDFLAMNDKAGGSLWSRSENGASPWTSFLQIMPDENRSYYCSRTSKTKQGAEYWTETLTDGKYELKHTVNAYNDGGLTISAEDFYPMKGFTYSHGKDGDGKDLPGEPGSAGRWKGAKFYYTRNSYTLKFFNRTEELTDQAKTVKYEAPLKDYNFEPAYPSDLEPNAYVFDGWYTTAGCYAGSEANLETMTMPASDVILYAKWTPKTHTVKTYLTKDAMDKGEAALDMWDAVPHGTTVTNPPNDPENSNYKFVGWFYLEDGVEKGFHFSMPVRKDLDLYAKWNSTVLVPYTVYYRIKGTNIDIADTTVGSGLATTTKTFNAKGGTALYADYQEGYFPLAKSTSITLNAEGENVCVIEYVAKTAVPYVVKYLDKETGKPVAEEKRVDDNKKAIVTENFVTVKGMMPDAYQKTLVVSAEDGAVNEIIFYYIQDTAHAYYKITHYTENLESDAQGNRTWKEYNSSQLVGDIGTEYTAEAITIPGFTYDPNVDGTVNKGELTADGLELKLYYTRNSYPYQVRYLEQGTNKELAPAKGGTGKYGQVILENAIDIHGYDVDAAQKTATIRIENPADIAKLNIITFYYTEKTVDIKYQVVGPTGSGTVTPTAETVKVFTGPVNGSTPTAADGFRFVGWFKDEACKEPVDESWVGADNKLTPEQTKDYGSGKMGYEAATYYAKFEYDVADLTISKSYSRMLDGNQSAVFTITGGDLGDGLKVVLNQGNGFKVTIKGLKVGTTYTVTEKNSWTWRYNSSNVESITLQASDNTVSFTNTLSNSYWLTGGAWCDNNWATGQKTKSN